MSVLTTTEIGLVAKRIQIQDDNASFEVLLSTPGTWDDISRLQEGQPPFEIEDYPDLGLFFGSLQAKKICISNPSKFNGKVLLPDTDFKNHPPELFSHQCGLSSLKGRLRFADGCILPTVEYGGLFRASGCPMIVASLEGRLAYAHGGFYCLIDRGYIANNRTIGRRWPSVIDSLLFALGAKTPKQRQAVHLWVFYSIRPEDFFHSLEDKVYRRHNEILQLYFEECRYTCFYMNGPRMHFNLPQLAREQALSRGLLDSNIHLDHAFLPEHYPTTRRGKGNYLVAVKRFDNMPKTRHK